MTLVTTPTGSYPRCVAKTVVPWCERFMPQPGSLGCHHKPCTLMAPDAAAGEVPAPPEAAATLSVTGPMTPAP